jgi:hypothetical protein
VIEKINDDDRHDDDSKTTAKRRRFKFFVVKDSDEREKLARKKMVLLRSPIILFSLALFLSLFPCGWMDLSPILLHRRSLHTLPRQRGRADIIGGVFGRN